MTASTVFIYALCDPETGSPRYVGKARNLRKRVRQHLQPYELKRSNHRTAWIKSLLAKGLRPMVQVLEEVNAAQWPEAERQHIAALKSAGADLVNGDDGGCGGNDGSEWSRAKSAERCATPEQRARTSRQFKGSIQSPIHRGLRHISQTYRRLITDGFTEYGAQLATSMRRWHAERPDVFPKKWATIGLETT